MQKTAPRQPAKRTARLLRTFVIVIVAFVLLMGGRWYQYVSNTRNPYDEAGIDLNRKMPAPIRKWGCDKLHKTFGDIPPPYGCGADNDWRQWR